MFRRARIAVVFYFIHASAAPAHIDLAPQFKRALDERRAVPVSIAFPNGAKLDGSVEATDKGNGILRLGRLDLRLQDLHDDGVLYAGQGILRLDTVDLGQPALVVSGIALHTGEKETDRPTPEAVTLIYLLDCAKGELRPVFNNTALPLASTVGKARPLRCKSAK